MPLTNQIETHLDKAIDLIEQLERDKANLTSALKVTTDQYNQTRVALKDMLALIEEHGTPTIKAHATRIMKAIEVVRLD